MPRFNVKVKNKASGKEMTLQVSGAHTANSVKRHVESMPGSHGGTHPGFEVISVADLDKPATSEAGKPTDSADAGIKPDQAKAPPAAEAQA